MSFNFVAAVTIHSDFGTQGGKKDVLFIMLLLLLLSRFSRVRHCATPQMAAYQAPPSLGFSRQEYWSGVPLPSLMTSLVC